jgi:hypothetical protein
VFVTRIRNRQRGQALVETAIMLPIALLCVFGILYLAHAGIMTERTQSAMRYAGFSGFYGQSNQAYTAADIYSNLQGGTQPVPCPTAPPGVFTDTAPYPGPASPPLWGPNWQVSSNCETVIQNIGGAEFLASRDIASTIVNVQTGITVPPFLQPLIGGTAVMFSQIAFAHPQYPGILMYCNSDTYNAVHGSITAMGSVGMPTPIPGGSPSPAPSGAPSPLPTSPVPTPTPFASTGSC